jgi:hypothetical protein
VLGKVGDEIQCHGSTRSNTSGAESGNRRGLCSPIRIPPKKGMRAIAVDGVWARTCGTLFVALTSALLSTKFLRKSIFSRDAMSISAVSPSCTRGARIACFTKQDTGIGLKGNKGRIRINGSKKSLGQMSEGNGVEHYTPILAEYQKTGVWG